MPFNVYGSISVTICTRGVICKTTLLMHRYAHTGVCCCCLGDCDVTKFSLEHLTLFGRVWDSGERTQAGTNGAEQTEGVSRQCSHTWAASPASRLLVSRTRICSLGSWWGGCSPKMAISAGAINRISTISYCTNQSTLHSQRRQTHRKRGI